MTDSLANAANNLEEPAPAVVGEMILQQPVACWLLVFATGILADATCPLPMAVWFCLATTHLIASLIAWRDPASLLLLAIGFIATGGLAHATCQRLVARSDIGAAMLDEGVPTVLDGVVDGRVRRWKGARGPRWSVTIRVTRVRDGARWRRSGGRAMVIGHGRWSQEPGTLVRWHGVLLRPSPAKNPGEIDSRQRLLTEQIRVELRMPQGAIPRPLPTTAPLSIAARIRRRACDVTVSMLPSDQAAVVQAMTWGERGSLRAEQKQRFLWTGTAHYLAISGLHLGMLCGLFLALNRFDFVPRRWVWIGMILFACGYALVCGARTPILRATWLVLVSVGGRWQGRRTLQWSRLAAAGWAVLILRPADLWDVGAQLSFLAVAILLLPSRNTSASSTSQSVSAIDKILRQTRPWWQQWSVQALRYLRAVYRVNLNICVLMAPLVALHFGFLALGAVAFSPLIGPPIAVALVTSFLMVVFSRVPLVSWGLRTSCLASLLAVDSILSLAGPSPPIWQTPQISSVFVRIFYFAWFVRHGLGGWPLRKIWLWRSLLAALWLVSLFAPLISVGPATGATGSKEFRLTFVSVGHGLAVIVETPDGEAWLYDSGSTGDGRYAAARVDGVLQHLGIQRLRGIVVSHFDADHYNATPMLAKKYSAECLVSNDERVHRWIRQVGGVSSDVESIVPQDREHDLADWGRLAAGADHGDDNERSLALFGVFGRNSFCLTGDLEGEGLNALLSGSPSPLSKSSIPPIDVLLVPHHGSRHSQPTRVAQWARPRWAIISGGWQDHNQSVTAAYREVGATLLHTDDGAIRVVLSRQEQPAVFQWRDGRWERIRHRRR